MGGAWATNCRGRNRRAYSQRLMSFVVGESLVRFAVSVRDEQHYLLIRLSFRHWSHGVAQKQ